jgi:hypothetical protein
MYRMTAYPDANTFNQIEAEMTSRGFKVHSINYTTDGISVVWDAQNGLTWKSDGTVANGWPRAKFAIRTYVDANEFNNNPLKGFGIRHIHYAVDKIYVLWYVSLEPPQNKATDATAFRERWRSSPRFRESPICPHITEETSRRRYYLSGEGIEYLCAICGESFTWDEAD